LIDTTAPFLQDIGLGGNYLPYDATSGDIGVQSNEPVEMRWSYEDKDFDLMENTFTCQNSSSLMDCLANIPIQGEVTTIYVRAKDHPEWKGTDRENQRNKNQQSIVIVIKKTKDRLVVDYAKPNNETFTVNTPIASINLEAGTSGGIDGSADCSFSIDRESFVEFRETGGKTHKQVIERSNEGMHGVNVSCTDKAGNKASRYITFTLKKDLIPPTIARMYRQFGKLVLVINEPGRCAYLNEVLEGKTNPCGFEFEQGVEMSGESGGYAQMADFDETKTYYIKCKDTLGNIKPGEECGAIIRGGQL
jgi:hypothetical protein